MSILTVKNLTHYYGDKLIFKDIHFQLLKNERAGLIGRNGAGKSTFLKVLNGSVLPDSGEIDWIPRIKAGYLEQHIAFEEGIDIQSYLRSAFKHLFDAERKMMQLTEKMGSCPEEELESLLSQFSKCQELLEHGDFYSIDRKIQEMADGLGISSLGMHTDTGKLSGGQRTKLLLAKLLLEKPDILLLDEPTNYLDRKHIDWLKEYLKNYPYSFILISHDTAFLNEVVNVIYHIEHNHLTRYQGNYAEFMKAYELRKQQMDYAYIRQQQEIHKLETYVQKNKARSSTSKQAKSREKKLMKINKIEKPSPPPLPAFSFRASGRPGSIITDMEQAVIGYNKALFPPLSLSLRRGEKTVITGHNGIGKSSILKTITGEITPLSGKVTVGLNVKPSYFAQEWMTISADTPLEYIWSLYPSMTQKEIRQELALTGLKQEHIFQPLSTLSGGEQTRVRLCQLMLEESNWLILDEPTNHLDPQAKGVLSTALKSYEGTILLVSHEPDFYQEWVTQVWDLEEIGESRFR